MSRQKYKWRLAWAAGIPVVQLCELHFGESWPSHCPVPRTLGRNQPGANDSAQEESIKLRFNVLPEK